MSKHINLLWLILLATQRLKQLVQMKYTLPLICFLAALCISLTPPPTGKLIGVYHKTFSPGIDGKTTYQLTIKKNFLFSETVKTKIHGKTRRIRISGKWSVHKDTLIFVPKMIRNKGKRFKCGQLKNKDKKGIWCKNDTLIYRKKGLWNYPISSVKVYEKE